MKKRKTSCLVFGAAALLTAAAFSGCGSNAKLDVMNYVKVTFTGMNGEGRPVIEFDEEAALAGIVAESKQGLSENEKTSIRNILSIAERDIAVSAESGLKNGDGITVTTKLDGSTLKEYKTAIKNSSKKFDVSGLVDGVTIDLADYVTFSFTGFDGHGTAYPGFDWDAYSVAVNAQVQAVAGGNTDAFSNVIYQVQNAPYVSAGEYYDLSNGDTVTASVTATPAEYDSIGIVLQGGEASQTVSGLEEPQEVDLSEAFTAKFSGLCPDVRVSYEINRDLPYADGIYRPDSSDAFLNNGDTLEGTVPYEESYLTRNGFIVANDTYSFTVSDLPTCIVDYTQEKAQETIKAWAEEKMAAGAFQGSVDAAETYLSDYTMADWQNAGVQLAGIYGSTAGEETLAGYAAGYDPNETTLPVPVYNKLYLLSLTSVPVLNGDGTSSVQNVWTVNSIGKLIQKPDGSLYDPYETIVDENGNNLEKTVYDENGNTVNYRVWDAWSFGTREEAMSAIESDVSAALGEDASMTAILENEVQEEDGTSGTAHVLPEVQKAQEAEVDQALISQAVAGPVVLDGHTYLAFHEVNGALLNWNQAKDFCEQNGGHLVTVGSMREQAALNYLRDLADRSIYYWIGLSDAEQEGVFTWVTGERAEFTYWDGGQPDNYTSSNEKGEDAIEAFYGSYGKWNDRPTDYDENGFMMEIEPAAEVSGTAVNLVDLTPSYSRAADLKWYRTDSFGDPHIYPMGMDARDRARLDYDLDGRYSLMNFSLSADGESNGDASIEFKVWGDGKLLYAQSDFKKTSVPQDVSLDVTGIGRISIQARSDSGYGVVILGEGQLIPAGEQAAVQKTAWLEDTENMTFVNAETTKPLPRDYSGRYWRDMYRMYNTSEMSWYLGGNYTRFQAVIAPAEDYDSRPADVKVYGDGTLLYEKKGYTSKEGAILMSADVSGVRVLTITNTPPEEGNRSQEIQLCDTLLLGGASAEEKEEVKEETEETEETEATGGWDIMDEAADGTGEYVFPELEEKNAAECAGSITCGDVRYFRFDKAVNHAMAATFAEQMGAVLAVPKTQEQRYAIAKLVEGNGDGWYHLGAYTMQSGNGWFCQDGTGITSADEICEQLPEQNADRPFLVERYDGDFGQTDSTTPYGYVVEVHAVSGPEQQAYSTLADFEWDAKGGTSDTEYLLPDGSYNLHALEMEFYDYTSVSIDLAGGYSTFSGELICDWMYDGQTASYAIFGDGKLLFEMNNFGAQDLEEPVPFEVDVTGVKTLSIEAKRIRVDDTMCLITANIRLLPAQTASPSAVTRLQKMDTVDKNNTDIYPNELFRDRNGVLHEGALRMNNGSAHLFYNLNGKYSTLSLTLTAGANTNEYDMVFQVLADDQVIWEETFNARTENITKELDVTGVRVLQIRKDTAEGAGGGSTLYLEDDILQ